MSFKYRRANTLFNKLLRIILKKYFIYRYNITYNTNNIKDIKSPYIILSNHVNNLDPFYIGAFIRQPVHFVASDEQFRNPLKKFFLTYLLGAIPKKKFVSDIETVKNVVKVIKNNDIVGIFPEGMRNWDGETTDIIPSTAKLIKMLKVPVVTAVLKGSHFTHPRWASKDRIGQIHISYEKTFSPEDLRSMSIEEIQKKLEKALYHDEYKYQSEKMIKYKGKNLAENLELFLFICPHCKSIAQLKSKGNNFFCTHCDFEVQYNNYGFFEPLSNVTYFNTTAQWNKWQLNFLKDYILNKKTNDKTGIILKDKFVNILVGSKLKPLTPLYKGDIVLDNKKLFIINSDVIVKTFNVNKISGLNVQYRNQFEFYYENELFRFKFDNYTTSAYKWTSALKLFKQTENLISKINCKDIETSKEKIHV